MKNYLGVMGARYITNNRAERRHVEKKIMRKRAAQYTDARDFPCSPTTFLSFVFIALGIAYCIAEDAARLRNQWQPHTKSILSCRPDLWLFGAAIFMLMVSGAKNIVSGLQVYFKRDTQKPRLFHNANTTPAETVSKESDLSNRSCAPKMNTGQTALADYSVNSPMVETHNTPVENSTLTKRQKRRDQQREDSPTPIREHHAAPEDLMVWSCVHRTPLSVVERASRGIAEHENRFNRVSRVFSIWCISSDDPRVDSHRQSWEKKPENIKKLITAGKPNKSSPAGHTENIYELVAPVDSRVIGYDVSEKGEPPLIVWCAFASRHSVINATVSALSRTKVIEILQKHLRALDLEQGNQQTAEDVLIVMRQKP